MGKGTSKFAYKCSCFFVLQLSVCMRIIRHVCINVYCKLPLRFGYVDAVGASGSPSEQNMTHTHFSHPTAGQLVEELLVQCLIVVFGACRHENIATDEFVHHLTIG